MEPRCPYFSECGGCSLQHIIYSEQLENKKKALIAAAGTEEVHVFSGKEYGYRQRIDVLFMPNGIGMRKKGSSSEIIRIEQCTIANERANKIINEINLHFKDNDACMPGRNDGTLRQAIIRSPEKSSAVVFCLNSNSKKVSEAVEKITQFAESTSAENVLIGFIEPEAKQLIVEEPFSVKGCLDASDTLLGINLLFPAEGFFQNNHDVAEMMHKHCKSLLEKYSTKDATLVDVYSGVGAFGIINARMFRKVIMAESFKRAAELAAENIRQNSITNAEALCIDAKSISRIKEPGKKIVITDPPRSGMDERAIENIRKLMPEAIIYVSCNLIQLKKDLPKFKGYIVKSAALFDMFPQTNHAEAVVELAMQYNG